MMHFYALLLGTQYVSKFRKLSSGTGLESFSFHFNPPKRQSQRLLYHKMVLIPCASKVMPQILQARLQQYLNWEHPHAQVGFRKGEGIRDQIANIHRIIGKVKEFQKSIDFCFIDYAKAFEYVDHNELWKILQGMGIPDHHTSPLRNVYAGKEARVRTRHGRID